MKRTAAFLALAAATASGIVASACSDGRDPQGDAAAAPLAEASLPDASSLDAGDVLDARPVYDGATVPVVCDASPCVTRIVAGHVHFCAILDDGTVRCWGHPPLLGGGADAGGEPGEPVRVEGLTGVVDVAASPARTCATVTNGDVSCWGEAEPSPTRLGDVPPATRFAINELMWCAIESSGALGCWGDFGFTTEYGKIDLGSASATDIAISTSGVGFVVDSNGVLRSWGSDLFLLGHGQDELRTPRPVSGVPAIRDVATSSRHACAVSTDGRLFCWGSGAKALLGLGHARDELYPVAVSFADLVWPQQIAVSETHSCVRTDHGSVYCWGGTNDWGELALANRGAIYVPGEVKGLPGDIVQVAVGLSSSCALTRAGAVWCWGVNSSGQLGRGGRDEDRHPVPAPVVFP